MTLSLHFYGGQSSHATEKAKTGHRKNRQRAAVLVNLCSLPFQTPTRLAAGLGPGSALSPAALTERLPVNSPLLPGSPASAYRGFRLQICNAARCILDLWMGAFNLPTTVNWAHRRRNFHCLSAEMPAWRQAGGRLHTAAGRPRILLGLVASRSLVVVLLKASRLFAGCLVLYGHRRGGFPLEAARRVR